MGMGSLGCPSTSPPWQASQATPSSCQVPVAGSSPVTWQTRQAPGLPCLVQSSTKAGSEAAWPGGPCCHSVANSVWQAMHGGVDGRAGLLGSAGVGSCARAITNVVAAAASATEMAITRRFKCQRIVHLLIFCVLSAMWGRGRDKHGASQASLIEVSVVVAEHLPAWQCRLEAGAVLPFCRGAVLDLPAFRFRHTRGLRTGLALSVPVESSQDQNSQNRDQNRYGDPDREADEDSEGSRRVVHLL